MGELSAQNEWSGFVKAAMAQNIPLNVHWDLTWRCDHKCVHCYLTDRKRDDLSLEEAITVLDQLVDAGTLSLLISGGDPFLRLMGSISSVRHGSGILMYASIHTEIL